MLGPWINFCLSSAFCSFFKVYLLMHVPSTFFGRSAWRVELPRPGMEPTPPAGEAWGLNRWTARGVPSFRSFLDSSNTFRLEESFHTL